MRAEAGSHSSSSSSIERACGWWAGTVPHWEERCSPGLHHGPHHPHLLHQHRLGGLRLGRVKHVGPQLGGGLERERGSQLDRLHALAGTSARSHQQAATWKRQARPTLKADSDDSPTESQATPSKSRAQTSRCAAAAAAAAAGRAAAAIPRLQRWGCSTAGAITRCAAARACIRSGGGGAWLGATTLEVGGRCARPKAMLRNGDPLTLCDHGPKKEAMLNPVQQGTWAGAFACIPAFPLLSGSTWYRGQRS